MTLYNVREKDFFFCFVGFFSFSLSPLFRVTRFGLGLWERVLILPAPVLRLPRTVGGEDDDEDDDADDDGVDDSVAT